MEGLREELHDLIKNGELTDPRTVEVSQKLDIEIVKHMKNQINISA